MKVLLALLFALLLRPVLSDDVPFCHAANCSAVSSNPVDCNPVDCKPVDCKPVNCKPVNSNPVDCKPVNCIPVDCQPVSCNCNPVECIPIPCLSTSAWKDPNTYIGGIVVFMMTIPLSYILYVFHFYQYAEKTVHQKMKNGWNWLWGRGKGEDDLEAGRLIEEPETDHANPELRVETAQPIREAHVETGRENREADLGADQDGQETYHDTNQGLTIPRVNIQDYENSAHVSSMDSGSTHLTARNAGSNRVVSQESASSASTHPRTISLGSISTLSADHEAQD